MIGMPGLAGLDAALQAVPAGAGSSGHKTTARLAASWIVELSRLFPAP